MEERKPTYYGQEADKGRIVVGTQYQGEGYAVIRCGNTEVQVGYTLLARVLLDTRSSSHGRDLADLQRAINSITCEASLGRTGDEQSQSKYVNKEMP